MLTVWEIVRKAELAQQNILQRLQDLSVQSQSASVSVSEENQFLSNEMMHEIECSNFNSFSQSVVKQCSQVCDSIQENKSIEKVQNTFTLAFNIKGKIFQITLDEEGPIDFQTLVEKVEQNIGSKLSVTGMEKILASIKIQIDESKIFKSNQLSVKQSKIDDKSTRKNSMISKGNANEKSNKENCFKIGHVNYQLISKVKKGLAPNVNGGRLFGAQKFSNN